MSGTEPTVLTDARGRKLTLRKLTVLDQARLLRAIGPAQSSNQPYTFLVQAAVAVAMIDGIACPTPTNERQIDARIAELGDEGIFAVQSWQIGEIQAAQTRMEDAADGGDPPPNPLPPSAGSSSTDPSAPPSG